MEGKGEEEGKEGSVCGQSESGDKQTGAASFLHLECTDLDEQQIHVHYMYTDTHAQIFYTVAT